MSCTEAKTHIDNYPTQSGMYANIALQYPYLLEPTMNQKKPPPDHHSARDKYPETFLTCQPLYHTISLAITLPN